MSIKITYFVHGTTTDNEKGLATGWSPGVLSELGIQQAEELGEQVKDKKFDIVISSDLQRAIDSANLGFGDKYEIIHDERLRECNYGDNTEHPAKEFKADMKPFVDTPFPNGESYKDVETRIRSFVDFLKENYEEKHVAIVAHQGPQLALDVVLKGKTWNQAIDEDWRKQHAWQPGWEYLVI
jgi:broad specificity phosphatase PhoE